MQDFKYPNENELLLLSFFGVLQVLFACFVFVGSMFLSYFDGTYEISLCLTRIVLAQEEYEDVSG